MSCGPVVPVGQLLTPVGRLHLGEVFRLPACLGSVAVAAQIEADGFADAGAARLAQLERQLIQLALQLCACLQGRGQPSLELPLLLEERYLLLACGRMVSLQKWGVNGGWGHDVGESPQVLDSEWIGQSMNRYQLIHGLPTPCSG